MRWRAVLLCTALAGPAARAAEPLAPPNLPPADTWVASGGGSLRVLDKQKAQSRLLRLKVGQTVHFETLAITLKACMVHPPLLPPDEAGFLAIADSRDGEPGFSGWMLSHEPGLAMLESPVYGVRVTGCEPPTDAAIAAATPAPGAAPTLDPNGAPPAGAPLPATAGTAASQPLTPSPSEPLGEAPAPPAAGAAPALPGPTPPGYIPAAPPGSLTPPGSLAAPAPGRPAAPASPAQPAAPASGGIY